MSSSTKPTFVHYGSWDDNTRTHEAMKWMEMYTHAVDAKVWNTEPSSKYFTPGAIYQRPTGEVVQGADAAWAAVREDYVPFATHLHDPQYLVCWETESGWEMLGVATLYWNLVAPGAGAKVKDSKGGEWDGTTQAAFDFWYKKEDGGIKLSKTCIYADRSGAVVEMLKRGMMKPEDLMK